MCIRDRCNTAPAIGLGAWFLARREGPTAIMAVLPSDHYIPDREQFAELLRQAGETAKKYGLVTFGITPRYPETGYGYICRGDRLDSNAFKVERFVAVSYTHLDVYKRQTLASR